MTHLFPRFNLQGPFTQRPSVGDLPSAVPSARIAFSLLLLTAQVLPKRSPLSLIRIHLLINGFMADGQLRGNLLGTPLHAQQGIGLIFHPRRYRAGVAAVRSGSAKLNRSDKCIIGVFSLGKGAGAGDLYEQIIWAANAPRV